MGEHVPGGPRVDADVVGVGLPGESPGSVAWRAEVLARALGDGGEAFEGGGGEVDLPLTAAMGQLPVASTAGPPGWPLP